MTAGISKFHMSVPRDIEMTVNNEKSEKSERGMVSVETVIFLSLFLVFFLCMLNIMKLVISQTIIQYALNQTAKEISQYSYVIAKAGLEDNIQRNSQSAGRMVGNTKGVFDSFLGFYNAIGRVMGGDISAGSIDNVNQSAGNAYNRATGYADYLQQYGKQDALGTIKDYLTQKGGALLSEVFVTNRVNLHLRMLIPGADADAMLKGMGIQNGLGGISCWNSSFYENGKDMNLVAEYAIDYNVPFLDIPPRKITLRASTGLW